MKLNSPMLAGALTAAVLNQGCIQPKTVGYNAASPKYVRDYDEVNLEELKKNLDIAAQGKMVISRNGVSTVSYPAEEISQVKVQATCLLIKLSIADKLGLSSVSNQSDSEGEAISFGTKTICQLLAQHQQAKASLEAIAKNKGLSLKSRGSNVWQKGGDYSGGEPRFMPQPGDPTPLEETGYNLLSAYDSALQFYAQSIEQGKTLSPLDKVKHESEITKQQTMFEVMLKHKLGSK